MIPKPTDSKCDRLCTMTGPTLVGTYYVPVSERRSCFKVSARAIKLKQWAPAPETLRTIGSPTTVGVNQGIAVDWHFYEVKRGVRCSLSCQDAAIPILSSGIRFVVADIPMHFKKAGV